MKEELKLIKKEEDAFSAEYIYEYKGYIIKESYDAEDDCTHHSASVYSGDKNLKQYNYGSCLDNAMAYVDAITKEQLTPFRVLIAQLNAARSYSCSKEKSDELKGIIYQLLPYAEVLDAISKNIKIEVRDESLFGTTGTHIIIVNDDLFKAKKITEAEYKLLKGWLEL